MSGVCFGWECGLLCIGWECGLLSLGWERWAVEYRVGEWDVAQVLSEREPKVIFSLYRYIRRYMRFDARCCNIYNAILPCTYAG
jgi:hypothetical protein